LQKFVPGIPSPEGESAVNADVSEAHSRTSPQLPTGVTEMTTTELVTYLKAHSYPAWSDDNETIKVVMPWVRRGGDGNVITGHNVQSVPARLPEVRSLIGC
jgi:hypothetical protein